MTNNYENFQCDNMSGSHSVISPFIVYNLRNISLNNKFKIPGFYLFIFLVQT